MKTYIFLILLILSSNIIAQYLFPDLVISGSVGAGIYEHAGTNDDGSPMYLCSSLDESGVIYYLYSSSNKWHIINFRNGIGITQTLSSSSFKGVPSMWDDSWQTDTYVSEGGYEDLVIRVSGAGTLSANGDYVWDYIYRDHTKIEGGSTSIFQIKQTDTGWAIYDYENSYNLYEVTTTQVFPPETGWSATEHASEPGPTLSIDLASNLPVELVSFTATNNDYGIVLNWQTATEVNNYGFSVMRFTESQKVTKERIGDSHYRWEEIGFVPGHGNDNSVNSYEFVDNTIDKDPALRGKYDNDKDFVIKYRLKQIDTDGSYEYSDIVEVTIAPQPVTFSLYQNYPNPFNPSTTISFTLPNDSMVRLDIYNVLGQLVSNLVDEHLSSGNYRYRFNAENLASGVYLYKLTAGNFVSTKKMIVTK